MSLKKRFDIRRAVTLAFLGLAVFLWSCADTSKERCQEKTDVFLNAGLFNDSTKKECSLKLSAYGLDRDSMWYSSQNLKSLEFPLNPNEEETDFVLVFEDGQVCDTLRFFYTNEPKLLSVVCGGIVVHHLQNVQTTRHGISSVEILEPEVTNSALQNLKILVR